MPCMKKKRPKKKRPYSKPEPKTESIMGLKPGWSHGFRVLKSCDMPCSPAQDNWGLDIRRPY